MSWNQFLKYAFIVTSLIDVISSNEAWQQTIRENRKQRRKEAQERQTSVTPPNIVVFVVDDLGWNQVGYHAKPSGNDEIRTPNIDYYATKAGIELDRGYMSPWCGPSRAAIITGRTNVYNFNVSSLISTFDDNIGYVAGLQTGTKTLATALKEYGESIGIPYTAWFNGKFGIGGTAFTNTPLALGFDEFRGFWGTGLENCDGLATPIGTVGTYFARPFDKEFGPNLINALPGYFEQHPDFDDVEWCPYIQSVPDDILSPQEKFIACKTRPRTLPKLLDLDLLDKVVDQITTHNYTKGPMLQYFCTAMLHQPIAYPKEYDVNASDVLPDYFQPGRIKPVPSNDDFRMSVNQAVRYMDDLFGSTMQAVKDAGQWDNTIVYFTSDNGGPIYSAAAANNYPLRSAKFSPFEGGTRVVQFMTGGWLDKNLPSNRTHKSETFIFPNDIAPTLLDMAGANVSLLLDGKSGAPYGNALWSYIRNSVDPTQGKSPKQMVRKVTISKELFFDVQENRTMKNVYTGNTSLPTPRLWEPIWPKNDDLLMDPNYLSVKPCRPNGRDNPSDCCLLDITNDYQERNPLPANCDDMEREGIYLFEIDGGCVKDENGTYTNLICLEPGAVTAGALPTKFSLWTQMGAAGPFTNSKGVPIDGLPMKCICESLADSADINDIDFFTLNVFSPSECITERPLDFLFRRDPALAVPCEGAPVLPGSKSEISTATLQTTSALLDAFVAEGLNKLQLVLLSEFERQELIFLILPTLYRALYTYLTREGYTEWPNVLKWPRLTGDTCPAKNATSLAYPPTTFPPYVFGGKTEVTFPIPSPFYGLCALYTDNKLFCPAHQNPYLEPVTHWSYNRFAPRGHFANGSIWSPYGFADCLTKCKIQAEGTAYIGDGPHGLLV